ncbi:ABC transporter C family member 13 [Hibiscus syriacus]|uniref:ABC transporter C family member 13 n=1 Tax=Hibiscus syriacus TaxID=106335 RepID=A0A6A2ZMP1_HIBSY|nr:ABC transporter C family member 13 [Hibiscus syriacus]
MSSRHRHIKFFIPFFLRHSTISQQSRFSPSETHLLAFIKSAFDQLQGPHHFWLNEDDGNKEILKKGGTVLVVAGRFFENSEKEGRHPGVILEKVKLLKQRFPSIVVIGFQDRISLTDEACFILSKDFKNPLVFPEKDLDIAMLNKDFEELSMQCKVKNTSVHNLQSFEDGEFESAKLLRPAASFYHDSEDCLYIVDSEVLINIIGLVPYVKNHAIRRADLEKRVLETIYPTSSNKRSTSLWTWIRTKLGFANDAVVKFKEHDSRALMCPWHLIKSGDNNFLIASRSFENLWVMDFASGVIKEAVKGLPNTLEFCRHFISEKGVLKLNRESEISSNFQFSNLGMLDLPYWLSFPLERFYALAAGLSVGQTDHIQKFSLLPGKVDIRLSIDIPNDTELVEPLHESCIWCQARGNATELSVVESVAGSSEKVGVAQQWYDELDNLAFESELVIEDDNATMDTNSQDKRIHIDCIVNTSPGTSEVIIYAALYLKLRRNHVVEDDNNQEKFAARIAIILNPKGNERICFHKDDSVPNSSPIRGSITVCGERQQVIVRVGFKLSVFCCFYVLLVQVVVLGFDGFGLIRKAVDGKVVDWFALALPAAQCFAWFVLSFSALHYGSNYYSSHVVANFAVTPALAFLCFVAIRGETGIEVCRNSELQEPLLLEEEARCLKVTPYSDAGLFSLVTLSWLNPLLSLGVKRPLELKDIPLLAQKYRAKSNYEVLNFNWEKLKAENLSEQPSLAWALGKSFWKEAVCNAVFALLNTLVSYVGPYMISYFVDYLGGQETFLHEGYVLAGIFFVSKLVETLTTRQWYLGVDILGMHVRSALTAMVYRKGMKLSSLAKQSHTSGEIVNYMAVDVQRVGDYSWYLHDIWMLTLQIILALVILYNNVGIASIATLIATIISIVATVPLAKVQEDYQDKLMAAKDERMRKTSEYKDRISGFLQEDVTIVLPRGMSKMAIEVKDGEFCWNPSSSRPTLSGIQMKVESGMRVAVCGTVGSGKSSFLSCILGEIPKISGEVQVCGTAAYASQLAWIQSENIEENVLFGSPMDKARYKSVINACFDLGKWVGVATDHLFYEKWVDRIPYFLPDLRRTKDVSDPGVGYGQGRISTLEPPFRFRPVTTASPPLIGAGPHRNHFILLKNSKTFRFCLDDTRGFAQKLLLLFPIKILMCYNSTGSNSWIVFWLKILRREDETRTEDFDVVMLQMTPSLSWISFVVKSKSNGPFVVKLNLRCLESNILRCEVEIGSETGKLLLTTSGPFFVKLNLRCLESNIFHCEVEIGSEIGKLLLTTSGPFVVKLNLRCLESNIPRCEIGSEIGKLLLTTSGPFVVKLNLRCLETNILRCEVEIGSEIGKLFIDNQRSLRREVELAFGPFVVKLNLHCLESNILRCEVEIGSEIGKLLLTTSGPSVVKLNLRCLESNILRCEVEIGSG